jgi:four helix bundle protein
MKKINTHKDLDVFKLSYKLAMEIFELSKKFPTEEKYSLTDQVRRSSRSISANIAEAFRKRRYEKAFVAKLNDCESEAAETQVWLDFALDCEYISEKIYKQLYSGYDHVLGKLVTMINQSNYWII